MPCLQAFLRDHGLRLILRGHEGKGPSCPAAHAAGGWHPAAGRDAAGILLCGIPQSSACGLKRWLQQGVRTLQSWPPISCAGPDARALRPDMPNMLQGFALDHDTPGEPSRAGARARGEGRPAVVRLAPETAAWLPPAALLVGQLCGEGSKPGCQRSFAAPARAATPLHLTPPLPPSPSPAGKLYTVFSAPQYPQFGALQHQNLGAVAVLAGPRWDEPRFVQFDAAPRPQVRGLGEWRRAGGGLGGYSELMQRHLPGTGVKGQANKHARPAAGSSQHPALFPPAHRCHGSLMLQASPYQPASESVELEAEDTAGGEEPASAAPGPASQPTRDSNSSEEEAEEEGQPQEVAKQGLRADARSATSLEIGPSSLQGESADARSGRQPESTKAEAAAGAGMAAVRKPADRELASGGQDAKRQRMLAEPVIA